MLGARLKYLRNNRKLSQQELADQLGMSRAAVTKYERNEREPDLKTLEQIADFFMVRTDYLLGRSEISSIYDNDMKLLEVLDKLEFENRAAFTNCVELLAKQVQANTDSIVILKAFNNLIPILFELDHGIKNSGNISEAIITLGEKRTQIENILQGIATYRLSEK